MMTEGDQLVFNALTWQKKLGHPLLVIKRFLNMLLVQNM